MTTTMNRENVSARAARRAFVAGRMIGYMPKGYSDYCYIQSAKYVNHNHRRKVFELILFYDNPSLFVLSDEYILEHEA